MIFTSPTHH